MYNTQVYEREWGHPICLFLSKGVLAYIRVFSSRLTSFGISHQGLKVSGRGAYMLQ